MKKTDPYRVTIVGAGHYARNLISPVYNDTEEIVITSVISPRTQAEDLRHTALEHVLLFRDFSQWKKHFGHTTPKDIFDFCVHHPAIPHLMDEFSNIGGTQCILPKPVAITEKAWDSIEKICRHDNIKCAVASQWFYSMLINRLADLIRPVKNTLKRIEIEFSQEFSAEQLKHYGPTSGFLPHMLQILSSIGFETNKLDGRILSRKDLGYGISYNKPLMINLVTNMGPRPQNKKRLRRVKIFSDSLNPFIEADLESYFMNGRIVRHSSIEYNSVKEEIQENNLKTMTQKILSAFHNNSIPFSENKEVLSLNAYRPIAHELIAIEKTTNPTGL